MFKKTQNTKRKNENCIFIENNKMRKRNAKNVHEINVKHNKLKIM